VRIVLKRIAVTNPSTDKSTPNMQAGRETLGKGGRYRASLQPPSWRRRGIWRKAAK